MGQFAIYIPGNDLPDPSKLDPIGLGHLKPGATWMPTRPGPDDKSGVIVSWPNDPTGPVGYLPDRQEWTDTGTGYWLGTFRGQLPTPANLAQREQLDGVPTRLGDGNLWRIPAAGLLPSNIVLGDDGEPIEVVEPQYQAYRAAAERWFLELLSIPEDATSIHFDDDVFAFLLLAVGLNYRLCEPLAERLGLFDGPSVLRALMAAAYGFRTTDDDTQAETGVDGGAAGPDSIDLPCETQAGVGATSGAMLA